MTPLENEVSHTAGPWKIEPGRDRFHVRSADGAYVGQTNDDLTGEANAHLIAAAPDLLEALEELMGGKKACGHDFECVCTHDKARKAIARAKSPSGKVRG